VLPRRPGFTRTFGKLLGSLAVLEVISGFRFHEALIPKHGISTSEMVIIVSTTMLGSGAGYGWIWLRLWRQRWSGGRYAIISTIILTDTSIIVGETLMELPDPRPTWTVRRKSTVWLAALAVGFFAQRMFVGLLSLAFIPPDPAPTLYRLLAMLMAGVVTYHFGSFPKQGYERWLRRVCGTGLAAGFLVPVIVTIAGGFTS